MKKLIVLFSMMFFIITYSSAQKGIQSAGIHLSYGTEIETVGMGMKYQYNLTNHIRFEPSMNYFFEKDNIDMFDINFNAHYILPLENNIRVYPLAGVTFTRWNLDLPDLDGWNNDGKKNKFGVNLGAGAEFDIQDEWMINFEVKYQLINKLDQAIISLGVAYIF